MVKRFFVASAAILCLVLAYHFGATSAQGQAGATVSGIAVAGGGRLIVMTPNGDCYAQPYNSEWDLMGPAHYMGNYWSGATSVIQQSWGGVKAKFK